MSMAAMPCTCCGRVLEYTEGKAVVTCPGCATRNIAPRVTGETLLTLQRATEQRLAADFHNAELSYQQVLLYRPDAHEALWGRLLCHYGVEYVEDPATHRRMPTVHTVQMKPLQAQPDFIKACKLAPDVICAQYEQDAAYIDDAQADIRQRAKSCPPYDVFLCHKTTKPGSKDKTEDFHRATQLYHFLKDQGVKVFFAPECLQNIAGANYEAGIYHALHTAKLMLLICSEPEYLTSPWVRSEWTRFLAITEQEPEKQIIPLLYDHFDPENLPPQFLFQSIQGMDMSDINAPQRLLTTVAKAVGKGAKQPEPMMEKQPEPVVEQKPEPVVEKKPEPKPEPAPVVVEEAQVEMKAERAPVQDSRKVVTVEFPNPHPLAPAIQKLALRVAANQYMPVQWGETLTVPLEYSTKFEIEREESDEQKKHLWIIGCVFAAILVVCGLITTGTLGWAFCAFAVFMGLGMPLIFVNARYRLKSFEVTPGCRYKVYWHKGLLGGYVLNVDEQ